MLKPPANPGGTPIEVFDGLRTSVQADRSQFWKELSLPFYGHNCPSAKVSEGVRESFWLQGMMAGFPAAYFCIKAFSETDQTEDLKKIDVPTLIMQGDDDQIVPFADSGLLQSKLVKGATLKVYKGAPHGLCTTLKDQVSEDLFAFCAASAKSRCTMAGPSWCCSPRSSCASSRPWCHHRVGTWSATRGPWRARGTGAPAPGRSGCHAAWTGVVSARDACFTRGKEGSF